MRSSVVRTTSVLPLLLPLFGAVHSLHLEQNVKRVAVPYGRAEDIKTSLEKRVDDNGCWEVFDDDENSEFDAVTADREAGLGMEFETGSILIVLDGKCSEDTTKVVLGCRKFAVPSPY